jgi:hypothetical protein
MNVQMNNNFTPAEKVVGETAILRIGNEQN